MEATLIALIVAALAATLGVLAAGLISMFRGGEFNRRHGNVLMRARIGTQATTVALILIYYLAYVES
ncbi:MAG: twin transmembrane helix small protein [Alphaproteobacteria bacterium]|nr:twin transmembrane helix small protein [Alphaproteobacteria bacterium]